MALFLQGKMRQIKATLESSEGMEERQDDESEVKMISSTLFQMTCLTEQYLPSVVLERHTGRKVLLEDYKASYPILQESQKYRHVRRVLTTRARLTASNGL